MAATAIAYAPLEAEAPATPAAKLYMMPALADMRGAETYLTRRGWYTMQDRSRLRRPAHAPQRLHTTVADAHSNSSSADEASDCEDCATCDEICPNPACQQWPSDSRRHVMQSRMHPRGNFNYNAYMMSAYDMTLSSMRTRSSAAVPLATAPMSDANTFCMFSMDGL